MRLLLATCAVFACTMGAAVSAQAQPRSPIIYNLAGDEVAVIKANTMRGGEPGFIVQPTHKYTGLGYYDIAIPASAVRPRQRGGWVTDITIDEFAYIPPTDDRFFWPSGI